MNPSIDVALKSIVGAYSVIFAGIFVFVWLMFGRQRKLEKKLDQLREDLREGEAIIAGPPGQEGRLRREAREAVVVSQEMHLDSDQPPRRFAPPLLTRRAI